MEKDKPLPLILGNRLMLRPMAESDASLIVQWRNDPEIMKWMFAQEKITIDSHLNWFYSRGSGRIDYMICLKEANRPIGTVNFSDIDKAAKSAEAGKMLGDRTQWGKGYAKEAFAMWLNFGFFHLDLEAIYIRTFASNSANICLLYTSPSPRDRTRSRMPSSA